MRGMISRLVPPSRPKDAATLILVRRGPGDPQVLMGQRPGNDQWPDTFVFPGGRVDSGDSRVAPATPLSARVEGLLSRACTPARARALAIAAVRETFEETGLLLGKPAATQSTVRPPWHSFAERGLAPALDELDYLCRAVTPPYRRKRFNARFFVARAEATQGAPRDSGELRNVAWVSLPSALELPIPQITTAVLGVLEDYLKNGGSDGARETVPLFKTVRGVHRRLRE